MSQVQLLNTQTIMQKNWIEMKSFYEIRELRPYLTKLFTFMRAYVKTMRYIKDTRLTRDLSSLYFTPNKKKTCFFNHSTPTSFLLSMRSKELFMHWKEKERRSIYNTPFFIYVLFIIKSKDRLEELCKTLGNSVSTLVSFCLIWINFYQLLVVN